MPKVNDYERLTWLGIEYDKRCAEIEELKAANERLRSENDKLLSVLHDATADNEVWKEQCNKHVAELGRLRDHLSSSDKKTFTEQERLRGEAKRQKDRAYRQIRKVNDLQEELDSWREREAACCPEDVGFDEYIEQLQKSHERLSVALQAHNLLVPTDMFGRLTSFDLEEEEEIEEGTPDRRDWDIGQRHCPRCEKTTNWLGGGYLITLRLTGEDHGAGIVMAREYCGRCQYTMLYSPDEDHKGWKK